MPILRAVLITRQAISPRLAMRILENISYPQRRWSFRPRHRFISDRPKLVAVVPVGPVVAVGEFVAQCVERVEIGDNSRQIPIGFPLVGRLVIVAEAIVVADFLAPDL